MSASETVFTDLSKKTRQFAVFVASILGVLPFAFFARAERLPVKTYTVADGLQRDFVFRVRQDSRGFLWFCTAEGISRFSRFNSGNLRECAGDNRKISR